MTIATEIVFSFTPSPGGLPDNKEDQLMKNEPVRSMTHGHFKDLVGTLVDGIPELTFDQAEAVGRSKAPLIVDVRRSIELYAGVLPIVTLTPAQVAVGIVKIVSIQIGGGRTTDQMVEATRKDYHYINANITQANMPSGYGKLRFVTLEFRQFDRDPYTEEVTDWQNEPGHGPSGYEDGLRFREYDPEAQRQQPHVFIPEAPWCDADGIPCALGLWSRFGDRGLGLGGCRPRDQWHRSCLFARRKYSIS